MKLNFDERQFLTSLSYSLLNEPNFATSIYTSAVNSKKYNTPIIKELEYIFKNPTATLCGDYNGRKEFLMREIGKIKDKEVRNIFEAALK
ncbi:hypothetical protein I6L33_19615 [Aeromonas sp. FDAARGOS 1403]|uniref:hypothetical protein n=1 Tax=Aeromonas TaxID=642 RepID=UPI001C2225F2|nr:hypothetical protein [Aeromonas sp. FDAARGOS 1403]QXA15217.1 hypothetical protein I6L33_19615 [Aeromonas sp. FDAARGOS 1403]